MVNLVKKKMGKFPGMYNLPRLNQEDKENMNITNYQRNANQNYNEVSPHTTQNANFKKSTNNKC